MVCLRNLDRGKTYKIDGIDLGRFVSMSGTVVLNARNTCQYNFEKGTVFGDKIDKVRVGGSRRQTRRVRRMKTKQSKRIV